MEVYDFNHNPRSNLEGKALYLLSEASESIKDWKDFCYLLPMPSADGLQKIVETCTEVTGEKFGIEANYFKDLPSQLKYLEKYHDHLHQFLLERAIKDVYKFVNAYEKLTESLNTDDESKADGKDNTDEAADNTDENEHDDTETASSLPKKFVDEFNKNLKHPKENHSVYLFKLGTGKCKVGESIDVSRRMKEIANDNRTTIDRWCCTEPMTHKDAFGFEKRILDHFMNRRTYGDFSAKTCREYLTESFDVVKDYMSCFENLIGEDYD